LIQRYTLSDFEALWQEDPLRFGCIPVQQAVDSLQMDDLFVSKLIDKGVLECFEIGDDSSVVRLVTLKSLLLFKTAKAAATKDRPSRILEVLTEAARNQKTLLFGDVMQSMGLSYKEASHREVFKKDLRQATRQSTLFAHGLLISALLVFRIQHLPEDDFFVMAQELGMFTPGKDSKTVFFKDHLDRIFKYYEGA
jgi:hypothetical protein